MKDAELWLSKAQEDFDTAKFNHNGGKYDYAAFLYQQAVEKALKALLIKGGAGLPKIHDCFVLAKRAKAPSRVTEKADDVSPYYFRTRYPDAGPIALTGEDIQRVADAAAEVIKWVKKQF